MARALRDIKSEFKEEVAILINHLSDDFDTPECIARCHFYGLSSYPRSYTDGIHDEMFSTSRIRNYINQRKQTSPPITITMSSSCPINSGEAIITITNISQSEISSTLQVFLKERHIDHPWASFQDVEFCVRDLLPDDKGEAITLPAGESVTKKRSFTIKSGWKKDNCRLVAFLQKSDKEIVEGCAIGVNEGTPIVNGIHKNSNPITVTIQNQTVQLFLPIKGIHKVKLTNLQGRTVLVFSCKGKEWVTLTKQIPYGVHVLHATAGKQKWTKKLVLY